MTLFLALGLVGVVLLLVTLVVGDHVDGVLDALGGAEWFTGSALAGFLGALGFVGELVLTASGSAPLAWTVGGVAGLGLGAGVGWVTARLRDAATGAAPGPAELVGAGAVVSTPIPPNGYGSVRLLHGGHLATLNARCDVPLPTGAAVWIVESLSASAVLVRPTHPDP